jgi:hypothetical protein
MAETTMAETTMDEASCNDEDCTGKDKDPNGGPQTTTQSTEESP